MNILLTIAARGGSKGIKNKNILPLDGKPLIAYTIEQALRWGKADKVVVTTDSELIAETALKYGAEVPFMRPSELATDSAPKLPVIRHALLASEKHYCSNYDLVVDLDPTAPVRAHDDLDKCLEIFIEQEPDSLVSAVHAHKNPYFNMVEKGDDGYYHLCKTLGAGFYTRQSAPEVYALNASIYFYRRGFLEDERNDFAIGGKTAIYVMDDRSAYDVDRKIDFDFLEFMIKSGSVSL